MKVHDDILNEIRARANDATPGPYFVTPQALLSEGDAREGRANDKDDYAGTLIGESMRKGDRDFFAMLHPARVLAIVDELAKFRHAFRILREHDGNREAAIKLALDQLDDEVPF